MQLDLEHKKVLITGGSRGIGKAIALKLAQEKAIVGVIARHKRDLAQVLQSMDTSQEHVGIACDLTKEGAPFKALQSFIKQVGHPDIVINNIGETLGITDPLCSIEDWRRMFRINFEIAVELNGACIPFMQKQRWGRIIHIASNAALENSGPVTYCVTKAALAAYALHQSKTLACDGIMMASILPGAIIAQGNYWDKTSISRPEHVKNYINDRLPLGRFGTPQEIGSMVASMCGPKAMIFSGAQVRIDGGQSRHF
jgi:3-oxoacyl-[acyl-carrier protein] reductase